MSERILKLDDQLCFALYAATNAVTRAYRPLLGDLGLTYPQYLVMLVLWQDGARPIGRIAERLKLGSSAVVPLVDQLQRSGFVTRRKDDIDRRVIHVDLTDAGRKLKAPSADAQAVVECRADMNEADFAALLDTLHALVERMTHVRSADRVEA